jgi:hypothetical protein
MEPDRSPFRPRKQISPVPPNIHSERYCAKIEGEEVPRFGRSLQRRFRTRPEEALLPSLSVMTVGSGRH